MNIENKSAEEIIRSAEEAMYHKKNDKDTTW